MKNPLRRIAWIRDWLDEREAARQANRLHRRYAPQLAEAIKNRDWELRDRIILDRSAESALIMHPIYGRRALRLATKAREYGILVPEPKTITNQEAADGEEDPNWLTSDITGDLIMTKTLERSLRREVKDERRTSYDEFRKWATLAFAIGGFILALFSITAKQKQPDPCQRNYYRNDAGQCVFGLQSLSTPQQAKEPKGKADRDSPKEVRGQ